MSVVNPTIDDLLSVTDENRFLLCEMAARRARDINDMMRNQHNRAEQLADVDDVTLFLNDENGHAPNPLSIAFAEIAPKKDADGSVTGVGDLSYDQRDLSAALGLEFDESAYAETLASYGEPTDAPLEDEPAGAAGVEPMLGGEGLLGAADAASALILDDCPSPADAE